MRHFARPASITAALGLLLASLALAQNPTATLTGTVTDSEGAPVPGVTVTAASSALQGVRSTVTSNNGGYKLAFLPAGDYTVTYELDGFKGVSREMKMSAAQNSVSDVTLELGVVTEAIEVTASQGAISESITGASTITLEEVEALPVQRTLNEIVNLAPGVANTSFRSSQLVVAGAPSGENLYMVNGVVINENIRAEILNLFIEDAIQETTTSISGVSAEYGRFTGGVVNAITKSGGNQFDGSFRVNYDNDDWIGKNELSPDRVDELNETYEATLGGYMWKDHLWFFAAGRNRETAGSGTTSVTRIPFGTTDEEDRYEAKLTVAPHPSHTIIGSYLEIDRSRTNTVFGSVLDERSLNANRKDPQDITSVNYTGILTSNFFVEAQYAERNFVIGDGSGGVPDLIEGTLIRNRVNGNRFWAPTFCGSCENEERNNENLIGKASYFLTTDKAGSHDIVFGYDTFEDIRFSINHQTGSDFTVYANEYITNPDGTIPLDSRFGSPFPVFDPNGARTPWIQWFAIFNEDLAQPTSFKTNSFYLNDRWQLNDRWSFNVGVRYDENDGVNSAGASVADDSKFSPRLGATFDLHGDGEWVFNASYGTYVAALANSIADGSSNGGAVGNLRFDYGGPPINVGCTPNVDCLASDEVLRLIFAWYASQGGVTDLSQLNPNAPIFDYLNQLDIPGATTQVVGGIASPSMDEYTLGVTKRLGNRGLIRADLVHREWSDFYGTRTNLGTGSVDTSGGPADVSQLGNFSSGIEREYNGLHTQLRYRLTDRFNVALNYTLSKAEGNFLGETSASGPVTATSENYPEYRQARWNYPNGDLSIDQRHKATLWGIYKVLNTDHHQLNASLLFSYNTGVPYGIYGSVNPSRFITNPGYNTPPTSVTYYATAPDAFRSDDVTRTDLALNYSFVFGSKRQFEIFIQPEVINVFNEDAVIDPFGWDDTGATFSSSFNPFTNPNPVQGTDYTVSNSFGKPQNELDYQTPRTFRFSVGFRF